MDTLFLMYVLVSTMVAFIFEGLSHGWRYLTEYVTGAMHTSYSRRWHTANVLFIFFFVLSVHGLCLGSDFHWTGVLDMYFIFGIFWIILTLIIARFIFFAPFFNIAAGNPLTYVGNTSSMDRFYHRYIEKWFPSPMVLSLRCFLFIILVLRILRIFS